MPGASTTQGHLGGSRRKPALYDFTYCGFPLIFGICRSVHDTTAQPNEEESSRQQDTRDFEVIGFSERTWIYPQKQHEGGAAIKQNEPSRCSRRFCVGEMGEFDVVERDRSAEDANMTEPAGAPIKENRFSPNRTQSRLHSHWPGKVNTTERLIIQGLMVADQSSQPVTCLEPPYQVQPAADKPNPLEISIGSLPQAQPLGMECGAKGEMTQC